MRTTEHVITKYCSHMAVTGLYGGFEVREVRLTQIQATVFTAGSAWQKLLLLHLVLLHCHWLSGVR